MDKQLMLCLSGGIAGRAVPGIRDISKAMSAAAVLFSVLNSRAIEIPCPTCPTWSHFIQDKLKIPINLSFGQVQMYKVNKILYFIF